MHRLRRRLVSTREKNQYFCVGLDEIIVHTEHGYVDALMAFFRARTRRPHGAVRTGPRGVLGDAAGREIAGREHPGAGARDSRVPTAGRRR